MLKKLCALIAFALIVAASAAGALTRPPAQDTLAAFKGNGCVTCHSQTQAPLGLSSRYFEWHISAHKDKGVGCDKCHGGDPGTADKLKAHVGMLKPNDAKSRLHAKNLPETCASCHRGVTSAFVESRHFQQLKDSGVGPSCTTCHAHMASEVIYTAEQTATLCSTCHNSPNALMPKRPEIPGQAAEVMQAIRRANSIYVWADRLIEEGHRRKTDIAEEEKEMKVVGAMLAEAKVGWHAFNLEAVRRKADAAFEAGTKVKDSLRAKLYPNH
jgi:predicted CXXCH cytochrome family protein